MTDLPTPPEFPPARWGELDVRFFPSPLPADRKCTFVVVFARIGERFVLANIPERGWITPSGRLEEGERPEQAAVRETWEEIGARLDQPVEIGYYEISAAGSEPMRAAAFVGEVTEFGAIPEGSESLDARAVSLADLPQVYWRWDPLLEAMFNYAAAWRLEA